MKCTICTLVDTKVVGFLGAVGGDSTEAVGDGIFSCDASQILLEMLPHTYCGRSNRISYGEQIFRNKRF